MSVQEELEFLEQGKVFWYHQNWFGSFHSHRIDQKNNFVYLPMIPEEDRSVPYSHYISFALLHMWTLFDISLLYIDYRFFLLYLHSHLHIHHRRTVHLDIQAEEEH
jgi:hypothetical protein